MTVYVFIFIQELKLIYRYDYTLVYDNLTKIRDIFSFIQNSHRVCISRFRVQVELEQVC